MLALTPIELSKFQSKRGRCLAFRTASDELMTLLVCIFPCSFNDDLIPQIYLSFLEKVNIG
jgi:hypothetical protein